MQQATDPGRQKGKFHVDSKTQHTRYKVETIDHRHYYEWLEQPSQQLLLYIL